MSEHWFVGWDMSGDRSCLILKMIVFDRAILDRRFEISIETFHRNLQTILVSANNDHRRSRKNKKNLLRMSDQQDLINCLVYGWRTSLVTENIDFFTHSTHYKRKQQNSSSLSHLARRIHHGDSLLNRRRFNDHSTAMFVVKIFWPHSHGSLHPNFKSFDKSKILLQTIRRSLRERMDINWSNDV